MLDIFDLTNQESRPYGVTYIPKHALYGILPRDYKLVQDMRAYARQLNGSTLKIIYDQFYFRTAQQRTLFLLKFSGADI